MQNDTIVVVEAETEWQNFVDFGPGDSSVAILAQQSGETLLDFAERGVRQLDTIEDVLKARRGVLVVRCGGGLKAQELRAVLLVSLVSAVERVGGRHVVVVAEGTYVERRQLVKLVSELNAELDRRDASVTIQLRSTAPATNQQLAGVA
jgi:hypothetical protein